MHTYSIDNDLRKQVIINIFIFSIIISSALTLLLRTPISNILIWFQQFDWIMEILNLSDKFGITTNFIGIPFIYTFTYILFDKYIWKTRIMRNILNMPNLNGNWKGTLYSITQRKNINMELDIKQTWSKISFITTFPKSRSESNMANMWIERDGITKVGFGFFNRSREMQHQYDGYNILELDSEDHLFGRYFNNRNNEDIGIRGGNVGNFELNRIV